MIHWYVEGGVLERGLTVSRLRDWQLPLGFVVVLWVGSRRWRARRRPTWYARRFDKQWIFNFERSYE